MNRAPAVAPSQTRALSSAARRRVLAAFVALHGVAHLAGTSEVLARASDGGSVEVLAGAGELSDAALLRVFGVLWALLAVGFVVTAAAVWTGRPGWPRLLVLAACASLGLVLVALWSSVVGVVIDVALLAVASRARALHRAGPAAARAEADRG